MNEKRKTTQGRPAARADWEDLHHRLHAAGVAVKQDWAPSPEEKKRILKARAQALACEPEPQKAGKDHMDVVEFLLAYERYGVKTSYIREVCPLRELTPMLCTPPFVLGIINLRGEILSVIDLKNFFELPQKGLTDLNKVLVVRTDGMELGILADVILGVRTISLLDLQPSLPTLTGIRAEYLQGVTNDRLVVLDVEKILSDKDIIVNADTDR